MYSDESENETEQCQDNDDEDDDDEYDDEDGGGNVVEKIWVNIARTNASNKKCVMCGKSRISQKHKG